MVIGTKEDQFQNTALINEMKIEFEPILVNGNALITN
jgi:hypothetical protein